MNTNIFNIDFSRLAEGLIPKRLRKAVNVAFANVVIAPFVFLYQDFLLFRSAKNYQLLITPQKCYLEKLLNDRYDFTLRRIYIDDGIDKPPFYIFRTVELKPKFIRRNSETLPKYIYTSGESGALTDDFIIYVPLALVFEEAEMISLVKVYKLAGTKFKIQRF